MHVCVYCTYVTCVYGVTALLVQGAGDENLVVAIGEHLGPYSV